MNKKIKRTNLKKEIFAPSSKSHTLRAILFASLAQGESIIRNYLISPDADAMINACKLLGANITKQDDVLKITGIAGKIKSPTDIINAGNSGIVLRFITAISALINSYTVITGDESIKTNRPISPLLDALKQLGAEIIKINNNHAPFIIKGPINSRATHISDGQDSQLVSALIIMAIFLDNPLEITVTNPGEKPWIDLTLYWLDKFNIKYINKNYEYYKIYNKKILKNFDYTVPGDFSSIAFPVAAAIITNSTIKINNIDISDPQGDKEIINILIKMGADLEIKNNKLFINSNNKIYKKLSGIDIDINDFIDAAPILAVIGCYATGTTRIYNAAIARKKECDRLAAITTELRKMGADIIENHDELIIKNSNLHHAQIDSHNDHRIAMSMSIAAFGIENYDKNSYSVIHNIECINKTYPNFFNIYQNTI